MQFLSTYLILLSFLWINIGFSQSKSSVVDTLSTDPEHEISILLGNSSLNNLPFGAIKFIQDYAKDSVQIKQDIINLNKTEKQLSPKKKIEIKKGSSSREYVKPNKHRKIKRRKAPKWNAHKKRRKISTRKCPSN